MDFIVGILAFVFLSLFLLVATCFLCLVLLHILNTIMEEVLGYHRARDVRKRAVGRYITPKLEKWGIN